MTHTLLILAVIVAAALVYYPILKRARVTLAERSAAGKSNGVMYAILLFPLIGPFLYLLFRRQLEVKPGE